MAKPSWKPVKVRLGQIKAWDQNPRMSTKAQAQRIIASERKFGQPVPFLLQPEINGRFPLLDGHQRLSAWFTVYGADYEMDAMVSDRPLDEAEHKELIITLHTGATGSWDWNQLSGWSAGDLQEWGMNSDALKGWDLDAANLKELLNSEGDLDNNYSRKIEAPIYTPKGDKPAIADLYDQKRAQELTAEIDAADLPEDEKQFLRIAANRHTVINFKRVAEYYAHSPAHVQRLMEDSALVIIDFKRAIELGYVKLSEEIAAQYLKDYPNA